MFLKRLEVIGFKSFAERIGIDFVPGVTAVVGPNGSGKVMSQMRFVGYLGSNRQSRYVEQRWKMLFSLGVTLVSHSTLQR